MTPEARDQSGEDELERNAETGESSATDADDAPPIDLDALDLSVETAEERISPSETNVFDK